MPEPLTSAETPKLPALMQHGSRLHQEGQLPHALMAFEDALKIAPGNLDASSAVATLLSLLGRPAAAYRALLAVAPGLMETADGATNLAIAAESCGDIARAREAYKLALELDPANLRALHNSGLMAAGLGQWDTAIAYAAKCVTLQPTEISHRQTLADVLTSARRYAAALEALDEADRRFPGYLDLTVRRIAVLAFNGNFEQSTALAASLDAHGQRHLNDFLAQSLKRPAAPFFDTPSAGTSFRPQQLFSVQAFTAMDECDWRHNDVLSRLLREAVTSGQADGELALANDSPFYALTLDLEETEVLAVQAASLVAATTGSEMLLPAFSPRTRPKSSLQDDRIRIGFAIQDIRQIPALRQHLSVCDHDRFAFYAYCFARPPEPYVEDALQPLANPMVEMAHMTDAEAGGRIRLDGLDIYVDTAPDARWYRPTITAARVARVQIRQHNWLTTLPPASWDYTVSDTFILPGDDAMERHGAVIRLRSTCWLQTHSEQAADSRPTRTSAGLPADTLVLCSPAPAAVVDALSFSHWMKILRSLPDAVLWLPACNATAAANLVREAGALGIQAHRLLFSPPMSASEMLAGQVHADLVLDTLRINQAQGTEDALRLGVPVITCSGTGMASRIGGSIVNAAGLPELITASPNDYVAEVIRLGRNPGALTALRHRIKESHAIAPLFDKASRIREWEAAWTIMTDRSRAGLPPAAFDVPAFTKGTRH